MVKDRHRPLTAHRFTSITAAVLLFIAFLLVLLVGLSLPIIKTVYLLKLKAQASGPATSVTTELRFGVWGVCPYSAIGTDEPNCYGPRLGYDIPDYIFALLGVSNSLGNTILKGLLAILILHLVGAGLSLLTLFFSLFLASHAFAIVATVSSTVTAIVMSLVLGIDLTLVITVKSKIKSTGYLLDVFFGNGVWMVVVAVAFTWISVILLSARACYCCGVGHRHRRSLALAKEKEGLSGNP